MAKKEKTKEKKDKTVYKRWSSLPILIFSLLAIFVAVAPKFLSWLPPILNGGAPVSDLLDISKYNWAMVKENLENIPFVLGVLSSAASAICAAISLFTGKKMARKFLTLTAFILFLGYGVYRAVTSGTDLITFMKGIDPGYYTTLGSSTLASICSFFGKIEDAAHKIKGAKDKLDNMVDSAKAKISSTRENSRLKKAES